MIMLFIFCLFICLMTAGVYWILKSDTNHPDTEFSLALMRMTVAIPKIGISLSEATKRMAELNEQFRALGVSLSKTGRE